jgi:tetratricopeptide (TPR) repeat protein
LANTDAATLLAGLHGQLPLPGTGESATLAAGLNYSLTHLPPADRVALVVLALFEGAVPATALILFSRDEGVPERFRGLESQWVWALERAAEVGLLTRLGKAMYAIHPALPAHLAELWRAEDPAAYQQQRANSEPALLSAYASFGSWLQGQIQEGSGASALHYMDLHRHMLGRMFGYALATRQWEQAEFIARPLNHYWNRNELVAESRYWVDRGRTALEAETGGPPPVDHPGGVLWLFLVGTQARRLVVTGQLDAAATTYTDMVTALRTQPESRQQRQQLAICYQELGTVANNQGRLGDAEQWCRRALGIMTELDDRVRTPAICADLGSIARSQGRLDEADEWIRQAFGFWEQSRDQMSMANGYHELGIIAQLRSRFDEAAQWYHKALDIKSELGDRYGMISAYHQLGMVAELCGRLAEADLWYRQALGLEEELRNRPRIAQTCHHLGRLAQERERFDEAEQWYRHSLAISEELDDKPGMTTSYGQLGILAQSRDRLDEAEQWYRRSHAVSEEFGSRAGMAKAHHQLGILAQLRGQFDEAEREYHKALAIEKELDDRPGMALTYAGLGLLTEQRGELELAMRWAVRSVSLFDEFPHPAAKAGTRHLLQLVDRFGVPALERCWATVTGAPLPTDIRTLLLAWLELPDTAGHDASG